MGPEIGVPVGVTGPGQMDAVSGQRGVQTALRRPERGIHIHQENALLLGDLGDDLVELLELFIVDGAIGAMFVGMG